MNFGSIIEEKLKNVFDKFNHQGQFDSFYELASGHINDTYFIKSRVKPNFILQRINDKVFKDVPGMIKNKIKISHHIQKKLNHLNKDELKRRVLTFVYTKDGSTYFKDDYGCFWNMTIFIEDSKTFEIVENEDIAYEAGKLFGDFLKHTDDFNVSDLVEAIPNFHKMSYRYSIFDEAISNSNKVRLEKSFPYINIVNELKNEMHILENMTNMGLFKLRVTHNDTKISNALFDNENKGLCVIDTDTVMPGIVLFDFGDAIRTICNNATEDETNLDKVSFNFNYYYAYKNGFLETLGNSLSETEINHLPLGVKTTIFIMALRFLTDYLLGDVYYKTGYPEHNLNRAKNQFKLIESFTEKMKSI
ncbi:phosphotransferase [Yeosuana sp. MJ-SS3]|uniref:Phosphotransferase n=1 Tax=Gilvirhabdus luticola TaxID=3079858 RepID=A0ABU3U991_9FLAO|nr:phosphotransferase [Yeosuana sp. MJ-SS3]MDU8886989.1 phosphotransferase [Yeosuana sp. MJ-SS3]